MNGFVNSAFGQDKKFMEEGNKWLCKNKEHGKEKESFHEERTCFLAESMVSKTLQEAD